MCLGSFPPRNIHIGRTHPSQADVSAHRDLLSYTTRHHPSQPFFFGFASLPTTQSRPLPTHLHPSTLVSSRYYASTAPYVATSATRIQRQSSVAIHSPRATPITVPSPRRPLATVLLDEEAHEERDGQCEPEDNDGEESAMSCATRSLFSHSVNELSDIESNGSAVEDDENRAPSKSSSSRQSILIRPTTPTPTPSRAPVSSLMLSSSSSRLLTSTSQSPSESDLGQRSVVDEETATAGFVLYQDRDGEEEKEDSQDDYRSILGEGGDVEDNADKDDEDRSMVRRPALATLFQSRDVESNVSNEGFSDDGAFEDSDGENGAGVPKRFRVPRSRPLTPTPSRVPCSSLMLSSSFSRHLSLSIRSPSESDLKHSDVFTEKTPDTIFFLHQDETTEGEDDEEGNHNVLQDAVKNNVNEDSDEKENHSMKSQPVLATLLEIQLSGNNLNEENMDGTNEEDSRSSIFRREPLAYLPISSYEFSDGDDSGNSDKENWFVHAGDAEESGSEAGDFQEDPEPDTENCPPTRASDTETSDSESEGSGDCEVSSISAGDH